MLVLATSFIILVSATILALILMRRRGKKCPGGLVSDEDVFKLGVRAYSAVAFIRCPIWASRFYDPTRHRAGRRGRRGRGLSVTERDVSNAVQSMVIRKLRCRGFGECNAVYRINEHALMGKPDGECGKEALEVTVVPDILGRHALAQKLIQAGFYADLLNKPVRLVFVKLGRSVKAIDVTVTPRVGKEFSQLLKDAFRRFVERGEIAIKTLKCDACKARDMCEYRGTPITRDVINKALAIAKRHGLITSGLEELLPRKEAS